MHPLSWVAKTEKIQIFYNGKMNCMCLKTTPNESKLNTFNKSYTKTCLVSEHPAKYEVARSLRVPQVIRSKKSCTFFG